ncbi:MAG: alpha/beta hydrolase, partial [Solirubrobacterales bacterium]
VVLDLPLGSHILPREPQADNGPVAVANLVADAIDALELDDVTLIGSDSGGAMSQVIVTTRPGRIGHLVLTSCDFRDNFPPKLFSFFKPMAAIPGGLWTLAQSLRIRPLRKLAITFGWLTKRGLDREAEDSYLLPMITRPEVRRDTRNFILGIDTAITNQAADRLGEFGKPVLIAWSAEDRVFPKKDAVSLAAAFPDARLEWVEDAFAFSMEDNPDHLAELIRSFLAQTPT